MYKIVLVDDEKIIRDSLMDNFNRDKSGVFEAYEASDGEDALEIIKQVRPDIVITDIRMPVIDGLQLSTMIKEQFKDVVIIVLSGFNEFSLVKNALSIGVFDYLLKPIKEDELDAVIKRAVEVVERIRHQRIQDRNIRQKITEGNLAIKENFLNNLIKNNYPVTDPIYLRLHTLNLNISFRNFFTVVFSVNEQSLKCFIDDVVLLNFSINNIIDECCKESIRNYELFTTTENNFVLISDDLKYNSQVMIQLINKIRNCIKKFLNVDLTIGISKNYDGVYCLKSSYDESIEKVNIKLYLGKDDISIGNDIEIKIPNIIFGQKEKLFINNVYMCEHEKAYEIIEEVYSQVDKMQLSLKQLKFFNIHVINCIVDIARNIDYDINSIEEGKSIYEKIDELKSIDAFKCFIKNITNTLIEVINKRKCCKKKKTIDSILKFIDEHYSEDLTLHTISEKFFIDYTNLSKMFKEDVGKLFSKYLIDLRIRRAKELLISSAKKIYEISEEVGYTDVRYFTKLFKEFEGITPMEFRKNKGIADFDKEVI